MANGQTLEAHVPVNSGAGDKKMTLDETTDKFLQNTGLAIPEGAAMKIRHAVVGIDALSMAEVAETLRAG